LFAVVYSVLLLALLWQVRRAGAPRAVTTEGALSRLPRTLLGMRVP